MAVADRRGVQAWKKIEDTKKKANDIIGVRQRNANNMDEKRQVHQARLHAEREQHMKNQMMRQH